MTAPNQDQSAEAQEGLIASIGQGALEIGGGDWSFGQDLTEEWGKSQYQIPGFSGVEDDSDSILAILYTLLTRLSSDVLDIIKTFIPGGALIEGVAEIAQAIMDALDADNISLSVGEARVQFDRFLGGGDNLASDPACYQPDMWRLEDNAEISDESTSLTLGKALKLTMPTPVEELEVNVVRNYAGNGQFTPVKPGDSFYLEGTVSAAAGNTGSLYAGVRLRYVDSTGTNGDHVETCPLVTPPGILYTTISVNTVVPSGYDQMFASVVMSEDADEGDEMFFDNVLLRDSTILDELISNIMGVPGAIMGDISTWFDNVNTFFGDLGLDDGSFDLETAVQSFIENVLLPPESDRRRRVGAG